MLKTSIALGFFLTQSLLLNPQVQGVANHLIGVMDTTQQAQTNPRIAKVQMTTCAVNFSPKQDNIYLYQEQAIIDRLNQPYRQRILVIQPSPDNSTVESKAYKLNNAPNFINFCNKDLTERKLNVSDLGESVCTVFLKPIAEGYRGETPPQGCPTNARGAVKITNTIILHSQGMDTSDRGYDSLGRQVWGAQDNVYQFRWQKP
jgi:hypothetical protein